MNLTKEGLSASILLRDGNRIYCSCTDPLTTNQYAFYVYRESELVKTTKYQKSPEYVYIPMKPGNYSIKVFIRNSEGETVTVRTEKAVYEGLCPDIPESSKEHERYPLWQCLVRVLCEIWDDRERMLRVSKYDYRTMNKDAYLGSIWNFLNPLIQIATYWFVFGFGIRAGRPVDGYPYLVWMLSGIIPWFFASACITHGAASIRQKGISILKMRYPIATIPLESVIVEMYSHLVMVGLLMVMLTVMGYPPTLHWLNLLYYMIFAVVFFSSLAMVTSVLSIVALDFQKLLNALIRLLFYLTPILWSIDQMPENVGRILSLNPIYYFVRGFRDSLLYQIPFYERLPELLFFWTFTFILLVFGCRLITRYRDQFIDLQ